MRSLIAAALAAAFVVAAGTPAPAVMSKKEAAAKCKAEYSTFDAEKRRSRTGYSFEKDMRFCVKQKMGMRR